MLFFSNKSFSQENKKDTTKANAEIIIFHAEKCMCCWGWEIKMNDSTTTIRSYDSILSKTIGSEKKYPIPIYIELAEKEKNCSKPHSVFDNYKIKKIKKII